MIDDLFYAIVLFVFVMGNVHILRTFLINFFALIILADYYGGYVKEKILIACIPYQLQFIIAGGQCASIQKV